jgi:Tol biopolymer transport system component
MKRYLKRLLWTLFVVSLLDEVTLAAMANGTLINQWTERVRSHRWVTAFSESSRSDRVPANVDSIVTILGGEEHIVYRMQPKDAELGEPIVSRDGMRLAFAKVERVGFQEIHGKLEFRKTIYVMDVDGSKLQGLVELRSPTIAMRGAQIGTPVAWSHDNQKILFVGTLKNDAAVMRPPDQFGVWGPTKMILIHVVSGRTEELLQLGPKMEGKSFFSPYISSQSWAPDNRRLAYMTDDGHVRILDIVTRNQDDLGAGLNPTWSPDGRFIAAQLPGDKKSRRDGDYVLISTEPPYKRSTLLSNARTLLSFRGLGYSGPAIWLPDSRFLVIWYYPGDQGYPYLLDHMTGNLAELPPRSSGSSWGGKP